MRRDGDGVAAEDVRTSDIVARIRAIRRRKQFGTLAVLPPPPVAMRVDVVQEKNLHWARLREAFDAFWAGSGDLPEEFREPVNDLEGAFRVIGQRVGETFNKALKS